MREIRTIALKGRALAIRVVVEGVRVTCPINRKTDECRVTVAYHAYKYALEAGDLRAYLAEFATRELCAEDVATEIADTLMDACKPHALAVTVEHSTEGVRLEVTASRPGR